MKLRKITAILLVMSMSIFLLLPINAASLPDDIWINVYEGGNIGIGWESISDDIGVVYYEVHKSERVSDIIGSGYSIIEMEPMTVDLGVYYFIDDEIVGNAEYCYHVVARGGDGMKVGQTTELCIRTTEGTLDENGERTPVIETIFVGGVKLIGYAIAITVLAGMVIVGAILSAL